MYLTPKLRWFKDFFINNCSKFAASRSPYRCSLKCEWRKVRTPQCSVAGNTRLPFNGTDKCNRKNVQIML